MITLETLQADIEVFKTQKKHSEEMALRYDGAIQCLQAKIDILNLAKANEPQSMELKVVEESKPTKRNSKTKKGS
jgi:hypothetical protein